MKVFKCKHNLEVPECLPCLGQAAKNATRMQESKEGIIPSEGAANSEAKIMVLIIANTHREAHDWAMNQGLKRQEVRVVTCPKGLMGAMNFTYKLLSWPVNVTIDELTQMQVRIDGRYGAKPYQSNKVKPLP